MATDIEQKLLAYGDNNLKLIRVSDNSAKNRFLGNILVSIRHIKDGVQEMFSVRVQPLTGTRAGSEKLSINKFEAIINHSERNILLGPSQGVQFEETLQNRGIATYALNELILALKNCCPNYSFIPYEFALPESTTITEREKLTAFLSKFNIALGFSDIDQRDGTIRAGQPQQLISHFNPEKIHELDLEEFIFQLVGERSKTENEINTMKAEINRMGDETFNGIPKSQLIKYTLICCGLALLLIFFLIK